MKILDPISGNEVELALKRLDARKDENIDEWAEKLAKDLVESGNAYDRQFSILNTGPFTFDKFYQNISEEDPSDYDVGC